MLLQNVLLALLFQGSISLANPAYVHQSPAFVSQVSASDIVNGSVPIDTSPLTPFAKPKISSINATAWEYWYFDGVSSNGSAGVTLAFFRDPSLVYLGQGILRVSVDAVWSNGSRFNTVAFAENSLVRGSDYWTEGFWTSNNLISSYAISNDFSQSTVQLDGPGFQGTYTLNSFTKARYPDGSSFPNGNASVTLAPLIYWNEAVPAGRVTANLVLNGNALQFEGIGGFDRNWGPFIWDFIADHWWWARAVTGPYSLVYWTFVSSIDRQTHTYAYLEKAGETVFASTKANASSSEDYSIFSLKYNGTVHGQFADNSTGFVIELVKPSNKRRYKFDIDHVNIVFESPGSNDEYSRFVNTAKGGEAGEKVFNGVSKSEQNRILHSFPIP
ncbi:hypothetical protein L228DRAFT_275923 [Xylona heveae TC161]|uniref:AttH domain-containing protein n=1 Tax=Xylona heveae (strain CBS 132557 / TC161) TaxID=1328760 RepID=A0A165IBI1_XYLHT|nr:hypothetical protein L228DRAFT_275923 [Xylona heveae TC161]KZF24669.1 hypothetical protein L228DRAFT_275923 [Xylona heveae TC161]